MKPVYAPKDVVVIAVDAGGEGSDGGCSDSNLFGQHDEYSLTDSVLVGGVAWLGSIAWPCRPGSKHSCAVKRVYFRVEFWVCVK